MKAAQLRRIGSKRERIEYLLRSSRSARRMRIRVTPDCVTVVAPVGTAAKRADGFVKENASWVRAQQAAVARLRVRRTPPAGRILFRGVFHPLRIERAPQHRATEISLNGSEIRLRISSNEKREPALLLRRWLRAEARRLILAAVEARARQMRVRYRRVFLRSQRTKWANCSPLRNLSFNWRLIMAPPEVLDYIVVHELAHLSEQRHTRRFWLIVQSHCPGFNAHQRWLQDHQDMLTSA